MLTVAACVATPVDRTERYAGPVPPCRAQVTGDAEQADLSPDGPLHEPGPWATWNTHPDQGCNDNPRIPVAATRRVVAVTGDAAELEYRDAQMYLTYPAASDPSVTGVANVAAGRFPVVVFAHANHDGVCEIFESYYSLHDHWASWGYVVAAVDGTPFNCDRGSTLNINLRAQQMSAAIDALAALNDDPTSRFFEHLDLDHVFLAGHSRGGGAAFVAAKTHPEVEGILTLQGIDPIAFGLSRAETNNDLPTLGITAGNDVDLNYPRVEPVEDGLTGPYSWVNINGGIHAYTADVVPLEFDDRPGVSRQNQHDLTELFTTTFLEHRLGRSDGEALFSLKGTELGRAISGKGVYQRFRSDAESIWVDRFDLTDPETNELGGANEPSGFLRAEVVYTYQPDAPTPAPRWRPATALLLSSAGPASYRMQLDVDGPLAVVEHPVLMFRVKGPDFGAVAPLEVAFVGHEEERVVRVDASNRGPTPLANRFQQVVIDAPVLAAGLHALEFRIPGGAIFIDDVRFTE